MQIGGNLSDEFKLGTFKVIGKVIIRSNEPTIDYIELDSTGKILTIGNLYNVHLGEYENATDDLYIEFTPHGSIKNKDGMSINTSVKVRELNGNKHF